MGILDTPGAVQAAIDSIRKGGLVIVVDDENRENEGDLIMAAEAATKDALAFMIRHTSGIICVPMERERLDALQIGPMSSSNTDAHRTAFTVSVDLKEGVSTGVSAQDRTLTIKGLVDSKSRPQDFARPGHVFPLECRQGGVLVRAGHTEAAVDLARLAGLRAAGILAELVNDDGTMKRLPDLLEFAQQCNLPIVSIDGLIRYRRTQERLVRRTQVGRVLTRFGEFGVVQYRCELEGTAPFALIKGEITTGAIPLVRVHVENTCSDILGIKRGREDVNPLDRALTVIASAPVGVLVYIPRRHDTRRDSVLSEVPTTGTTSHAGEHVEWRETGIGSEILSDLGAREILLLDDTDAWYAGLEGFGIVVRDRVRLEHEAS